MAGGPHFWNNARINPIRAVLGSGGYPSNITFTGGGSTEYAFLRDNLPGVVGAPWGWAFDGDGGKKTPCGAAGYDTHYRIHARSDTDQNYDPSYGYWVIGATHRDVKECPGSPWEFGYSESSENTVAVAWRNRLGPAYVAEDYTFLNNAEPWRWECNASECHVWISDGNASLFFV